jgi:hypothetical protein
MKLMEKGWMSRRNVGKRFSSEIFMVQSGFDEDGGDSGK